MLISDWSSDVCSSDLLPLLLGGWLRVRDVVPVTRGTVRFRAVDSLCAVARSPAGRSQRRRLCARRVADGHRTRRPTGRSEEHTSELQSLMRISYAVFCLKKKKK